MISFFFSSFVIIMQTVLSNAVQKVQFSKREQDLPEVALGEIFKKLHATDFLL